MAEIAKNPIKKYEKGLPCMLGEVVGRIIGESEEGSWGEINGEKMFSIPYFSSPHGTVVETGVFYLSEITDDGMKILEGYEKELIDGDKELYSGRLEESDYNQLK